MHGTAYTINDSILELLNSLQESSDQEVLLPVIGSLFQELNLSENSNQQAYRQLITDIASVVIASNALGDDGRKQFDWLKKLSSSGHDITALQALVKNIKAENLAADPACIKEPGHQVSTPQHEAPLTASTPDIDDEPLQEAQEEIKPAFRQFTSSLSDRLNNPAETEVFEENDFNSQEIKTLKKHLQQRLDSTKSQCKEFESLMQLLLSDLRDATNEAELETIRAMLKRSIQRLLSEHETISSNIIDVANELNQFETHCEQLNHELGLVKQLSLTDELTRLPNRRAFLKRLQNESGRVQRYGYPLAVAILDLDRFKEVNDTYGHAIGDEVLQAYTKRVLSTFRNYDLVARYGGEEFAVLLPHTDIYGAERALNKVLQKTLETSLPAPHGDGAIRLPSFSAGIAVYKEGESIESVINRADKAMYSAKKMGRNRVVVEADIA